MILITLVALSPFQHRKNLRVYDCCNSSFLQSLDLFGQVAKMQRRAATTRYPRIILISRYLVCPSHSHTHFGAANGTARGPFCAIPDNLVGSPARVEFGPQIRRIREFERKPNPLTDKGPNRACHSGKQAKPLSHIHHFFRSFSVQRNLQSFLPKMAMPLWVYRPHRG
jgi:hypothetical protein